MTRRLLCLLLPLLLVASAASADYDVMPTRSVFSLAYNRLQTALSRARPVAWYASVQPTQLGGYSDAALEAMTAMLSELMLCGLVQAGEDAGYMDAALQVDGREVITIGHTTDGERTGLNLGSGWLSIPVDMQMEAAAMLELDALGLGLLGFDYAGLRGGSIPFITPFFREGYRLWSLASPYSNDNGSRSVPSGPTSHATDYEMDTAALRATLSAWADSLSIEGLSLGLAGTDLFLGVSEEAFAELVESIREFARTVTLASPLKFKLAFGEGDILCLVNGSGKLQQESGSKSISYSYRCDLGKKKITRKISVDFQPRDADTLVLSCTMSTSSNSRSKSTSDLSLTLSGQYQGQPYRIRIKSKMENRYTLAESGELTEEITGTLTALVEYGGEVVVDIDVARSGQSTSMPGLTGALAIEDTFDVRIEDAESVLFAGLVTVGFSADQGVQSAPDVLMDARLLEDVDIMAMGELRDSLKDTYANARQRFIQLLPVAVMSALINAY